MLSQLVLTIAIVALFHAAFSAYERMPSLIRHLIVLQHTYYHLDLSLLKALGRPESFIQSSIVLESFVALFLGIIGACLKAHPLKEITWASEMKTRKIDDMDARMGFANFVTRGRVLGKEAVPSS